MKRFYFSRARTVSTNPSLGRYLVSGVVEGVSLEAAQASMDHVFRTRGLSDTHLDFAWQDLDTIKDSLGGILATTVLEAY